MKSHGNSPVSIGLRLALLLHQQRCMRQWLSGKFENMLMLFVGTTQFKYFSCHVVLIIFIEIYNEDWNFKDSSIMSSKAMFMTMTIRQNWKHDNVICEHGTVHKFFMSCYVNYIYWNLQWRLKFLKLMESNF